MAAAAVEDEKHSNERHRRRNKSGQATIYVDSDENLQQRPDSTVDNPPQQQPPHRHHQHRHKPRHDRPDAKEKRRTQSSNATREAQPKGDLPRGRRHSETSRHEERHESRKHKKVENETVDEATVIKKTRRDRTAEQKHRHRDHRHRRRDEGSEAKSQKTQKGRHNSDVVDKHGTEEPKKRLTLSERFSYPCDEFTFDENISIGIHRAMSSRTAKPPAEVTHEIDLDQFMLSRRRDEGRRPMFMREEILKFHYDDCLDEQLDAEEKRTIRVDKQRDRKSSAFHGSDITRTVAGGHIRNRVGYDRRRSWNVPEDYRGLTRGEESHQKDARSNLPDFSKRPDRYRFDERFLDPEVIPRGGDYFDHDNRDEFMPGRFVNYPRGRGGYRDGGRGGYRDGGRGGYGRRGRGPAYERQSSDFGGKWKHDMFEIVNQEEPSSTTAG